MLNENEIKEVETVHKMFNAKISDCNKCPYLNITEEMQNEIYNKTGIKPSHICQKYKTKVVHRCVLSNRQEHHKIFPLDICNTKEIEIYFANGGNQCQIKKK